MLESLFAKRYLVFMDICVLFDSREHHRLMIGI